MGRATGIVRILAAGMLAVGLVAAGSAGSGASPSTATDAAHASALDDWASVTAFGRATCGIRLDRSLWCWGANAEGQLGLGDTRNRWKPYEVDAGATWAEVDAALDDTCGLQTDGTLWCWGADFGTAPQQVGDVTTWTQISVGAGYSCGVQSDTSLWCWGENGYGQLGLGDYAEHPDPTEVGTDWRSVSASSYSTCGVKTDGTLWCWGNDEYGQLGDDQAGYPWTDLPQLVAPGSTWSAVQQVGSWACGRQTDATLWCWGNNDFGQLGQGDDGGGTYRYVPTQVGMHADWSSFTAGGATACGVRGHARQWCWGDNAWGQLGIGSKGNSADLPVQVVGDGHWDQPSAGGQYTCATQVDHTLWCWGNPDEGELGVGNRTKDTTVPVQVGLPNGRTPVSHRLVSVSADSATDIWAVGTQQRKKIVTTFVLHGDGSTWTRVQAKDPARRDTELTAVTALAPDDVWAVGSYRRGTATYPLTEHWDGTRWTTVDAPGGHHPCAEFLAVDASGPDDVWAVGRTFYPVGGYDDNFVDHWDGTSWTSYDISNNWSEQGMTGVVAISPHNAWTVGYGLDDEEAGVLPVTYHWNGTAWRQVLPKHGDRFRSYYLRGVDATPAKDLWAAGDWPTSCCREDTRIEHRPVGGPWKVVDAPSPGVGSGAYVRAVSAVAADDVWMVGDFDNGTSRRFLALHWDGSQWSQVDAPSPGGKYDPTGASVSAVASDDVWAVGSWNNGVVDQPYVEHWDGTAWTVALKGTP